MTVKTSEASFANTAEHIHRVIQFLECAGLGIGRFYQIARTFSPSYGVFTRLVDAVWREMPDFRESYEVAEGLYLRSVPAYDEKVVRELLVNARKLKQIFDSTISYQVPLFQRP